MNIQTPLSQFSESLEELVGSVAGRVVSVHGRDGIPSSGVILRRGIVVTAEEALERDDELQIGLPSGHVISATLVGRDPSTDVAVLRFDADFEASEPVASDVGVGALVLAVGRASGVLAAMGMIASKGEAWRSSLGGVIDARIRLGLSLSRSAEGGALVDVKGQLVGMPVFGPGRRVIAIPTATLMRAADRILVHGTVSRGYVGVGVQLVQVGGQSASMVTSVDPAGPAGTAGIILGDIVTRWNGEPLRGPRALVNRLTPESVGTVVQLGIQRAGKELNLKLTVAPRPKD